VDHREPWPPPTARSTDLSKRTAWILITVGVVVLVGLGIATHRIKVYRASSVTTTIPYVTVNATITNDFHEPVVVHECGWNCTYREGGNPALLQPGKSVVVAENVGFTSPVTVETPAGEWLGCLPFQYPPTTTKSTDSVKVSSMIHIDVQDCLSRTMPQFKA